MNKHLLLLIILTSLTACSQVRTPSHPSYPTTFSQSGKASYYADKYHGRQTASGERFNQNSLTAAHKTLDFDTWIKVTNINNGKSVVVKINDRGPFIKGRIIDLSKAAFSKIANPRLGVISVVMQPIPK